MKNISFFFRTFPHDTYSCFIFGTVSKEGCRWEFLPQHDGRAEKHHLTHRHATAGGMIEWQGTVEHIIVPKIGNTMDCGGNINVAWVRYHGSFWKACRSRCIDVEKLIVMARFLDLVCWRWISWHLRCEQLKIFSVCCHWQVDFIVELVELDVGAEFGFDFLNRWKFA